MPKKEQAGFGHVEVVNGFYVLHTVTGKKMLEDLEPGCFKRMRKVAKQHNCQLCNQTAWPPEISALILEATPHIEEANNVSLTPRSRCVRRIDEAPNIGEAIDFVTIFEPHAAVPPGETLQ